VTGAVVTANTGSGTDPLIKLTGGSDNAIDLLGTTGHTIAHVNVDTTLGSGMGVSDDGNNVGTVAISNMLINTASGNGLTFTHGGTLTVTGTNHIVTTTGIALDISNTNIGSSGLTFHDISDNGGTNGIILNNTGTSGGLTVTGDSGSAVNASGGVITASTGVGISLTNTSNVSLDQVTVQNGGDDGINGSTVTNFSLTNSTVTNNGNALNEHGLDFTNLLGTGTFTNDTFSNNEHNQVQIINNTVAASSASVTFDGVHVSSTGLASAPDGSMGIEFDTQNAASADLTVKNSSFDNLFSNSIEAFGEGTGVLEVTINNDTFTNVGASAINIAQQNNNSGTPGTVRFNIHDNGTAAAPTFLKGSNNAVSNSINIDQADDANHTTGGVLEGQITNNFIGDNSSSTSASTGGYGVSATSISPGTMTVQVDHNNIKGTLGGIFVSLGEDANAAHTVNATIDDNTINVSDVNAFNGIFVDIGTLTGDAGTGRLDMFNNTVSTTGAADGNANGISVTSRFSTTLQMPGYTGTFNDATAVQTYLDNTKANNVTGSLPWFIFADAAPGGFSNTSPAGSAVPLPTLPSPLLAAPGGVQASSPTPGEMHLTQAELDSVVAAAIAEWAAAGASTSQLAALNATTFSVGDLAGSIVGEQIPGHITIDTNAAGHGWFVDPTPSDNSEFTHALNAAGTDLLTDPSNAAAGHLDLLTTVTHELGHVLALPDNTDPSDANDLMYINLVDGERRIVASSDVVEASTTPATSMTPAVSIGPAAVAAAGGAPASTVIDAGHGGGTLVGTAGADNFVFANVSVQGPAAPPITHVANYSFAQGDTFDFSALTSQSHGWQVGDASVVRAVEGAGGAAMLQVNTVDSSMGTKVGSNWVTVAEIDGAHIGDTVNVLIDSHSAIHVAQVHVDVLV
jgi:hypothetical protein